MHGGTPKSSILFSDGLWFSLINQPLRTGYPHKLPICSMVLEYLPTKLGNFWGKCWCSYSSTMVRIWVRKPPNESLVSIGKSLENPLKWWKIHGPPNDVSPVRGSPDCLVEECHAGDQKGTDDLGTGATKRRGLKRIFEASSGKDPIKSYL